MKLYDADHFSCIVYEFGPLPASLYAVACTKPIETICGNHIQVDVKSYVIAPRNDMVKLHIGLLVLFIIYALHTLSSSLHKNTVCALRIPFLELSQMEVKLET